MTEEINPLFIHEKPSLIKTYLAWILFISLFITLIFSLIENQKLLKTSQELKLDGALIYNDLVHMADRNALNGKPVTGNEFIELQVNWRRSLYQIMLDYNDNDLTLKVNTTIKCWNEHDILLTERVSQDILNEKQLDCIEWDASTRYRVKELMDSRYQGFLCVHQTDCAYTATDVNA
jgi:hypothetical protein